MTNCRFGCGLLMAAALALGACTPSEAPQELSPSPAAIPASALASPSPSPLPTPSASVEPVDLGPRPSAPGEFVFPARASRVTIPAMGIDLPIVSSDLQPPPNFPLCDVAQYLTTYRQPTDEGTTYIYAHAREGMFLPLLEASRRGDGAELLGVEVQVYSDDGQLHRYEIFEVERGAKDYGLADSTPPGERRLILQTSEGAGADVPKLVVGAEYLESVEVPIEEATPEAEPRECT